MLCQPSLGHLFPRSPSVDGHRAFSPSLLFPNMGGFAACSRPSLPVWHLLCSPDRSGQLLQAEHRAQLCFDRLGAFQDLREVLWVQPNTPRGLGLFVAIAGATVSWCFESSGRDHCCAVVHATRLLLQGRDVALASLATPIPFLCLPWAEQCRMCVLSGSAGRRTPCKDCERPS